MQRTVSISLSSIALQTLCQKLIFRSGVACAMALCLGGALSGCSKRFDDMPAYLPFAVSEYPNHSVGRFKTSYLAQQIDRHYRGTNPGPLGVTTFVNVDDLYSTSTFGRMYAEQLMSELAMRGFDVVELRHADALQFLDSTGEFALSRDTAFVRRERELGGVVVGTYVVSPQRVYVNARLIDPTSSVILSAASAEMGKTPEIAKLLRGGGFSTTLERIPVRHLGFSSYPLLNPNQYGKVYDVEEMTGAGAPSPWSAGHGQMYPSAVGRQLPPVSGRAAEFAPEEKQPAKAGARARSPAK